MPETTELQQALAANPAPAAGNEPLSTPGVEVTQPADPQQSDDLPASVKEYLAANPGAKDAVDVVTREMRRELTPRLQEAAELRKLTEGIDPQVIQAVRYLNTLDAQSQAATLRQWADSLTPQQQAQIAAATGAGQPNPEYMSDTERAIWERQQEQERRFQQLETQAFAQHINAEMDRLQGEIGVKIPIQARAAAGELAKRAGIPVADAYFAINRETLLKTTADRARQEAASIVQDKIGQAAGNPAGVANRAPDRPDTGGPRPFSEIFAAEREARGI